MLQVPSRLFLQVLFLQSFFLYGSFVPAVQAVGGKPFDSAVQKYLDGKYDDAALSLQALAKTDASNAKVHYYLGLSYMRLKERDKAEPEFQWIQERSKDPALQAVAQTWLTRIDHRRKQIGDNYSVAPPTVAKEHGPVTRVLWFYTNWCPKCKKFRDSFEQAKTIFSGVKFDRLNAEDPANWDKVAIYKVRSYPTLVYFDKKGSVIENYAAAPMGETFNIHLKDLGAIRN